MYREFPNEKPRLRREGIADYDLTVMPFDRWFRLVDNGPDIPPELYDTKSDPRENVNLRKHPVHQQ